MQTKISEIQKLFSEFFRSMVALHILGLLAGLVLFGRE